MLNKLIKEIEDIEVKGTFFNPVTEVASRMGLIEDPMLGAQLVQLIAIIDKKNQLNFELRKQNSEEDDE